MCSLIIYFLKLVSFNNLGSGYLNCLTSSEKVIDLKALSHFSLSLLRIEQKFNIVVLVKYMYQYQCAVLDKYT